VIPFQIDQNEILTFFAVLVRFSVLVAVLPFLGDRVVPVTLKVLLSLIVTVILYPVLVERGVVVPSDAMIWSASVYGIVKVIILEAVFGLIIGFIARLVFMVIDVGANFAGIFMGFGMASQYDPHSESQTQVVARLQGAVAMLLFLSLNGHHVMISAALESYSQVGMGKLHLTGDFFEGLLSLSASVIRIGMQLAAPMAVSLFGINVVYAVMARAIPQMNVLVLSFSVSALVGLFVMFLSFPEFHHTSGALFSQMGDHMGESMSKLGGR